jgi:trimeric autotransporter adhesin
MKNLNQRLALLTGVSVSALGLATPAIAATNPGIEHVVTSPNVDDTLTICAIDDACDFGVTSSGAGSVSATVGSAPTGQVRQIGTATAVGGDVTLHMANDGDAAFSAVASASGAGGAATAFASIAPAIEQSGQGQGDVALDLTNGGTIHIGAVADASATTSAFALATAFGGVQQFANSTGAGDAAIEMTNNGTIAAAGTAHAQASGRAQATAAAVYGIGAQAVAAGGDAAVDLTNNGGLNVSASAAATGGHTGDALAVAAGGMVAMATGGGGAVAAIVNGGALTVEADAHASATTNALAIAIGVTGVYEVAHAASGIALGGFENGGSIDVAANATATGLVAQATAVGGAALFAGAVFQSVAAASGSASGVLDNSGDINVAANADANGSVIAYANAFGGPGVEQLVFASGGDATADLANSGTILLSANADASATNSAFATALYFNGFNNAAFAGSGDAVANMSNGGTLAIDVTAQAVADSVAGAHAMASHLVGQLAFAFSGDAQANLSNVGSIAIGANAAAVGSSAAASATLATAVYQNASAVGGGSATAVLTNEGTIGINAQAFASGSFASAAAIVQTGVHQNAFASLSGDAAATIANIGTISVGATASANGNDGPALALAVVDDAVYQSAVALDGVASASLANDGSIDIVANAHAQGGGATTTFVSGTMTFTQILGASATAFVGAGIYQSAYGVDGAALSLANTGDINIAAVAAATGEVAYAQAQIQYGISQYAFSTSHDAAIGFVNSGTINETAAASAHGTAGYGVALAVLTSAAFQLASGADHATVTFDNSGTIAAHVTAVASGVTGAGAGAFLNEGINQFAIASGTAVASMTNSGSIFFDAAAAAQADSGHATGIAFVSHGISQHAYGGPAANVSLTNSGDITIAATGSAVASSRAFGEAAVFEGIFQSASASGAATASFVNSGTLEISANAHGNGNVGRAIAVIAPAIVQEAWGTAALATLDNSGKIDLSAIAQATGGIGAPALAEATAIAQLALSGTANLVNSGTIAVNASAKATDTGSSAFVGVQALGILQVGHNSLNQFDNSGTLSVKAVADAGGKRGYESGSATGYYVRGDGAELDVDNSGTIEVEALGTAPTGARMEAIGIRADAIGGSAATSTQPALISGSIVNEGILKVFATANGAGPATSQTFSGATVTFDQSSAQAIGVSMYVGDTTATITNSGTIDVEAVTANGGPATAYGIWVQNNQTGQAPGASDVLTINNDGGTIIARQSTDGGDTWQRGMAIDVATAPNATVINLLGDGNIYGDIAVQTGDEINVADGTTYFDGIINPSFLPAGGVTSADLDSGLFGVGTLNIGAGGNLVLADPRITGDASMYDGPAYAFVDTLNVASDGTLTYELQPAAGGAQPVGSYPQVFADTANLDGTLVADVTTPNGLFANSYFWNNVIDANVRNGTFDQCVVGGAYSGSLLLSAACTYDANANVDLTLTRTAFNAVAGLNANGVAVGSGLECIYDVGLTGGAADMFADLFLFTNAANYNAALNMLSGSVYANYLNSFPSLGAHYNDLTDHATNCDVPAVGGSVLECRAGGPIHIWGQLDYQTRKADGDIEAGTSRSKRFTGLLGLDTNVGNAAIVGVDGGYVTNHVRDSQFGDEAKGDGWQVGAYAVYDPGNFFVKGITTYSSMNGDSRRTVDFHGLATGATFGGKLDGSPDVRMWTAGLHGGARFPLGATSVITPYLDYDYVHAKLDGFTETGLPGANLTVESSSSNHSFLTGGAKWATQLGGVVPEVNLGYRYRFGDQRSTFGAFFNGDTECDFDVVSAAQKRGTFLAGLSIGGKLGPVDVRIGYEGEFDGDVTSHSGNFRFVVPLGGHHAAPPPPPPAPVVAPPPPPPVAQPSPPPPPPPAPVERGERGM